MSAHLTRRGLWVASSGLLFVVAGVVASVPVVFWIGMLHVLTLFGAALLCLSGALALDRRYLRAAVRKHEEGTTGAGALGHVAGDTLDATLELTNDATLPLFGLSLEAYSFGALDVSAISGISRIAPGETLECDLELTADQSGRWTLQGFDTLVSDPLGLIRTQDYLPCRRGFAFYPDAGEFAGEARRKQRARALDREGASHRSEQDTGHVIRELRDYQPGDPLRHIAWKATVRTRRLIAREFEDERARSTLLLLDISGSMRGGRRRGEKLEHAIELVADLADDLIRAQNRVGLVTFDEKVYGFLASASSRRHYRRMLDHLIGLHSIVDPDLTEFDETELFELLADYLLVQDRLDFREDDEEGRVDAELMRRWITRRLDDERETCDHSPLRHGVVDRDLPPEREFAQLRGIPVPYRVESRLGPKGRGLAEALERITTETSVPHDIVAITDLCGLTNLEILEDSLALLRSHDHRVRFVVPFTPSYYRRELKADASHKRDVLLELFTAAEREERFEGIEFLRSKGIPVSLIGAGSERASPEALESVE